MEVGFGDNGYKENKIDVVSYWVYYRFGKSNLGIK